MRLYPQTSSELNHFLLLAPVESQSASSQVWTMSVEHAQKAPASVSDLAQGSKRGIRRPTRTSYAQCMAVPTMGALGFCEVHCRVIWQRSIRRPIVFLRQNRSDVEAE